MKTKILLMLCMTIMCNNAFADCGTSASNLCYETHTREDGTIYKQGWYYTNGGYGNITKVNKYIIAGCADGYYMPSANKGYMTTAVLNKCQGKTTLTTIDEVAIDECCWPCPSYDGSNAYQNCYRIVYGTDMYVDECDQDWCRSSVSNKNPYDGITSCRASLQYPDDGASGGDSTGKWVIGSACNFVGTEQNVYETCDCYPRSDYTKPCK